MSGRQYWHPPLNRRCRHPLDQLLPNGNCGACGVFVTGLPGLHMQPRPKGERESEDR